MIRFSKVAPHMVQALTAATAVQIDRAQSMSAPVALNREPNKEIGTDGIVDYSKGIPEVSYTLTQKEPLTITTFRHFAGKTSGSVSLSDFRTTATDIYWYMTDDSGTVLGTMWYPKLRMNGFNISISDPNSQIERGFDLVGEIAKYFQGNQKYLIYKNETVNSGELVLTDFTVTLNDPVPVEDEKNAGTYMLRVTRIRSGVATDLSSGATGYEFSAPSTLVIHNAVLADDYKIIYTSGSLPGGGTTWTANTSDPGGTMAYNVSAWIGSGANQLTRVQGITIDVSLDRADEGEVGNREKVVRGSNDETVTITLPRKLEDYVLDEVLLGQASGFGHIDVDDYLSNITFVLKVYEETSKSTFAYGLKISNCSPTEVNDSIDIDSYEDRGTTLESRTMVLSSLESDLAF